MPLSSLLFRRKPDTSSRVTTNNPPPQHPPHLPPCPPPPPPSQLSAITQRHLLGLKTLADPHLPGDDHHHHLCFKRSSVVLSSSPSACSSFSTSSSSSMSASSRGSDHGASLDHKGDCFKLDDEEEEGGGGEAVEEEEEEEDRCCWASYGRRSGVRRRLPPPITALTKAGEKKCLMPWALRRSYEDGGRLVVRQVKLGNQEYLKACRAGGRLTLRFVSLYERGDPMRAPKTPTAPMPIPPPPSNGRATAAPALMPPSPTTSTEGETCRGGPLRAPRGAVCSREDGQRPAMFASSSLPEANKKGCYVKARAQSFFEMVPAARMPPVHS